MSYLPIVPALIPTSLADVQSFAAQCTFAREIQIDVVDGQFTPSVSWPYQPAGEPLQVKTSTDKYTLEVDLMVSDPLVAAEAWIKAGADMLVFHVETISLRALEDFAAAAPVSVGVAFHGETTLETFIPYATAADYIQVMGVTTIGAQGQAFDSATLEKVTELRYQFPDYSIGVDGGVNKETIARLFSAGADRFVAGSAILKAPDPALAFEELQALLRA